MRPQQIPKQGGAASRTANNENRRDRFLTHSIDKVTSPDSHVGRYSSHSLPVNIRNKTIGACALLIATILLCFWGVDQNEFVKLDDPAYVTANAAVKDGLTLGGIVKVFTSVPGSYWQPLAFLSHMVDVQLFGMEPGLHHLTSVFWHCVNTALLFVALARLTGAFYRSLLVAAIFALHPMHVEPVVWIAARKELLSAFFFCGGLLLYALYKEAGGALRYTGLCVAFALGLMAKPNIAGFPLILLLIDFWPLRKKVEILEKLPLFLLAGISFLITSSTIAVSGQLMSDAHPHTQNVPTLLKMALITVQYLPKFFWPGTLSIFYITRFDWLPALGAAAAIAGISGVAIHFRKLVPYAFVGWFWFLILILPTSGATVADRFSYLPFIGLSMAVVWGAAELVAGQRTLQWCASAGAVAVLATGGLLSARQVPSWRTTRTLYENALAHEEGNYMLHQWWAGVLAGERNLPDAIVEYEKALAIYPGSYTGQINCAKAYAQSGASEDAIRHFAEAAKLRPETPTTYKEMGDVMFAQGRFVEAQGYYKKAQALNYPNAQELEQLLRNVNAALGWSNR